MAIHRLAELSRDDLRSFDRDRVLFVIPVGGLEQHGPHLPIGTDSFMAEAAAVQMMRVLDDRRPAWELALFPTIWLGTQPIDEINSTIGSVGSIPIRSSVLRDLLVDLGCSIGKCGFRYIVVVSRHGGPLHVGAIAAACEFVSDTLGMGMFYVRFATTRRVLTRANRLMKSPFSSNDLEDIMIEVHAGCAETSCMLDLTPGLVNKEYDQLPPVPLKRIADMFTKGIEPDWPGYFGFPHRATDEFGRCLVAVAGEELAEGVLAVLDGGEYPGYAGGEQTRQRDMDRRRLEEEAEMEGKIADWLWVKGVRQ